MPSNAVFANANKDTADATILAATNGRITGSILITDDSKLDGAKVKVFANDGANKAHVLTVSHDINTRNVDVFADDLTFAIEGGGSEVDITMTFYN